MQIGVPGGLHNAVQKHLRRALPVRHEHRIEAIVRTIVLFPVVTSEACPYESVSISHTRQLNALAQRSAASW
jgi:hypothetical protein